MDDAQTISRKLLDLDGEIASLQANITDLEAQRVVVLADGFLAGNGDQDQTAAQFQAELARVKAQRTEKESIRPILCDRLQAARQVLRQQRITAHSASITKAEATQEEITRQVAALDAQRLRLLQQFGQEENEMILNVHERSKLQQPRDAWSGTLEALAALAYDPEAQIRPDEIERVLAEWRRKEQLEGSKILHVELAFETESGKIFSAQITGVRGQEELKELAFIERDRAARNEQKERAQRDSEALDAWHAAQRAAKAQR